MQKDNQIKVSVIILIYNGMPFLENCVNSVIGQTYKNIEIILIDDGSTDGSGMLCEKFQQTDERIKVISACIIIKKKWFDGMEGCFKRDVKTPGR